MAQMSDRAVIEAVRRACGRSAARISGRMKRGVNSLATIASIAPWLGLLLTLLGIVNSFRGINGEKSAIMAALANSLAEAIAPAALGLLVAIPALWFYKY